MTTEHNNFLTVISKEHALLHQTAANVIKDAISDSTPTIASCNCLISYREGLGTSLYIMGLATIDPHNQKEHTEIHKIPRFGVNRASFD